MKIDVHQHLWTGPLIEALAGRHELPFVRIEQGLTVLHLAGECPYVIDVDAETPDRAAKLVELDGLDRALICLSSPLGIESLARSEARPLLDAYHEGALALGDPFGVWGAIALDGPDPDEVDDLLEDGCVGISLPAGVLASVAGLRRLGPVLARLELRGAPLLIHPGPGTLPGRGRSAGEGTLGDPVWWPALTSYVSEMSAAWLAFLAAGRHRHAELRVIFSMLAGLAPVHAERLTARGGPGASAPDPLLFYEISSYGRKAIALMQQAVGPAQLLYGSDRPVVDPRRLHLPSDPGWERFGACAARALARTPLQAVGV